MIFVNKVAGLILKLNDIDRHKLSFSVQFNELFGASFWQYMEELIGSIVFCWVTCGVSLVALVEVIYYCFFHFDAL